MRYSTSLDNIGEKPANCAVRSINAINTRLTMLNGNVRPYTFKNINKWFNDDIIISLSVIRQAIIEETNDRMRRFFWCCFAETVKKFSNTRTSTFKLHIKDQSKIEATVDDDTIIVTVPVTGEKGEGSVELIFTNDIYLTLTSCTLNLNKSMGELMGKAALNTLIGMGTVFVVLILISLIISCFSFIPKLQEKFSKKAAPAPAAAPVPAAPVVEEEELADDTELVAVIAAAIAAYEGTSTDGFQVRSIKRASTRKWKNA